MRRLVTAVALVASALLTPVAARAQYLLFDYVGFDYESPKLAQFGDVGSGYVSLGTVPALFAPLVFNLTINEYTYRISGLTSLSKTPFGTYQVINYSPGIIEVFEDLKSGGTAADFGNPATFVDGTPYLVGQLTNFQIVINTANGSGSFEAALTVTGGSQYANIPASDRDGWTFAGLTGNATNIPNGYEHQVDGQVFLAQSTPARKTSWGNIKALYR